MEVLALADDLTGALEVGAKFAGSGIAALVTTELSLDPAGIEVLVIDTESRHLAPAEAADRIHLLSGAARERGVRFVYKKTDSTLRGNIGSELGALLAAWPDSPLIYAPAYPQMGRTVRDGRLYVHGTPVNETPFARDPRNPIGDSRIPRMLAAQCDRPVRSVKVTALNRATAAGILVCDGETEAELEAAARFIAESGCALAAGPAGLAHYLAQLAVLPRKRPAAWPSIRSCLVVNGSMHELSARQVSEAEAGGWPSAEAAGVARAVSGSGWVILREEPARLSQTVRRLLGEVALDALAVFGGDTAFGILECLGCRRLAPLGEIVPGVPLSRAGELYWITKAGGFGSPDLLGVLRSRLT